MPGTLTIGDFAKATHLSVKALRHYHGLGLLVPAEIDAGSGYRRCGVDQISTAHIIRRFRELEMPLDADIDRAYGSLAGYVTEHAISLDGPIRETDVVGHCDTDQSARWVTEIGWPIFHPGSAEPS